MPSWRGVCLFREPDAGNLPVRFDEREPETEPRQTGLKQRRESFVSSHREANATAPVLDSTRVSDNVGGVKYFLRTLPHALEEERHFALAEKTLPVPTKARSQSIQVRISIRPMHLFGPLLRS